MAEPTTAADEQFQQFWRSHKGICYETTARAAFDAGRADTERQKYQPCERMSTCCGTPVSAHAEVFYCRACYRLANWKCSTHGCGWPDEGECPAAVKAES